MQSHPASFPRKKIAFDVVSSKASFSSLPARSYAREVQRSAGAKTIDGIHTEKKAFLRELSKRSFMDSLMFALRRSQIYFRRTKRLLLACIPDLAPKKMVYASIVSGIAFGMVSMAFIAHIFGAGVFARSVEPEKVIAGGSATLESSGGPVAEYDPSQDVFFEYFDEATQEQYEKNIRQMVKGYPIEAMLPYIFEQDRMTAAFLIGIGKKESNWGKRAPVLEEQDCFNYWGYRGIRRMMGSGGHTCFNSRKDAVVTVAARLNKLIHSEKLDTPEKLIVWKCGFSCEGHSRESVKKWISDVDMYYEELKADE